MVISFEPPSQLRAFAIREDIPFLLLSDPKREAYAAFELGRKPLRGVYTAATVLAYLRGLFKRRLPRLPRHTDTLQMGGDVIVSREGRIVFLHRSRDPADRPSIGDILGILQGLKQAW